MADNQPQKKHPHGQKATRLYTRAVHLGYRRSQRYVVTEEGALAF